MGTHPGETVQDKYQRNGVGAVATGSSVFFSQTTNIIVSFIAAKAVVDGQMTLGMMMALTYIIGQLSAPVEQFIRLCPFVPGCPD